jgi:GAF domain-containing protein
MLLTPMLDRLRACSSVGAVWSLLVTDVVALLGAEFGIARLLDADGVLKVISTFRFAPEYLALIGPVTLSSSAVSARAARGQDVVVIHDLEKDVGYSPYRLVARSAGIRSMVSAPIMDHRGVLGVVSAHFAHTHSPSPLELSTLREYCGECCRYLRDLGQSGADAVDSVSNSETPRTPRGPDHARH